MISMTLSEFVKKISGEFMDTDPGIIISSTVFKELEEWDSLLALSIISMIDEEFEIRVTGNDMLESNTIEDLYNLVVSRS